MRAILLKIVIILIPFLLYQLFFSYLIDILLLAHRELPPTFKEYTKIIVFNLVYMLIAIFLTSLNLKFAKQKNYKMLITFLILLVGIMGWAIDVLSLANYDMFRGNPIDLSKTYILKESKTLLLAIFVIILYWLSPWYLIEKKPSPHSTK